MNKEVVIKKVGSNIRKQRLSKGLSLNKLSIESGIDYSLLSRIEHDKINTSIYQFYKISKSLDTKMSILVEEL